MAKEIRMAKPGTADWEGNRFRLAFREHGKNRSMTGMAKTRDLFDGRRIFLAVKIVNELFWGKIKKGIIRFFFFY